MARDPASEHALPMTGAAPERADAARNRRRILEAARELAAERGAGAVSLDEVARRAGVGKATLFRRFGDRRSLFLALLDEHERELQDRVLDGPPPLGPGAPPAQRLHAFADALLDVTVEHLDLLLASETASPLGRVTTGAYAAWHLHVATLLAEAGAGSPDDTAVRAHLFLAAYDAELLTALTTGGTSPAAIARALHREVDGLLG